MSKRESRRRFGGNVAGSVVGAVVLAIVLAGCTQPAEASHLQAPVIAWEKGEPTGPEWNSEWAAAYRNAMIQIALAGAYGDYSDPELIAALGYDSAVLEAGRAEGSRFGSESAQRRFYERDATFAFRGTILAIEASADESSARVRGCFTTLQGGNLVGDSEDWVITRGPDGTYTANSDGGGSYDECHDAELWVGKWATPIDFDNVGRDKVKMPLPRDYYVKLGVISK